MLDRAIEVVQDTRIARHEGDANLLLPQILGGFEPAVRTIVFHSHALNQFSPAAKVALERILAEASAVRDIHRISMEGGEEHSSIDVYSYRGGQRDGSAHLGIYDAHGAWFAWSDIC